MHQSEKENLRPPDQEGGEEVGPCMGICFKADAPYMEHCTHGVQQIPTTSPIAMPQVGEMGIQLIGALRLRYGLLHEEEDDPKIKRRNRAQRQDKLRMSL